MITVTGIPVIETERLRLRGPLASDADAIQRFLTSDRAKTVGGPILPGQAWRALAHIAGHWMLRGYSAFVFADKVTDAPLGMCGPWMPEGWPEGEIAWSVWEETAEGKGYAFEAAQAARRFAYDGLGWTTAVSLIAEGNLRSEALANRMGCVCEGVFTFETGATARVWRHPGPEVAL